MRVELGPPDNHSYGVDRSQTPQGLDQLTQWSNIFGGIPKDRDAVIGFTRTERGRKLLEDPHSKSALSGLTVALTLSVITIDELPDDLHAVYADLPEIADAVRIKPGHNGWLLCSDAEERLGVSRKESLVAGVFDTPQEVDPILEVKGVGRLSGICIKTSRTPAGQVFRQGIWYAPVDVDTRTDYNEALDNGRGRVGIGNSTWTVLRYGYSDMPMYVPHSYPELFPTALARRAELRQLYRTDNFPSYSRP